MILVNRKYTLIFMLIIVVLLSEDIYPVQSSADQIDQIIFSSYIGGDGKDFGRLASTIDEEGYIYIGFLSDSLESPCDHSFIDYSDKIEVGSHTDIYILKLDPSGKSVFLTRIGGTGNEEIKDIEVDEEGFIYLTGGTTSDDFPISSNPIKNTNRRGTWDAFITKLNPEGNEIVFSTYLGTEKRELGYQIEIDKDHNIYTAGCTYSENFIVTDDALFSSYRGGNNDIYLVKLNKRGEPVYSSYIGGNGFEEPLSLKIDMNGFLYLSGVTESTDYKSTDRAYRKKHSGWSHDIFSMKIDRSMRRILYCTYIGGKGLDNIWDTEVDNKGNLYLTGFTTSPDFPTTHNSFDRIYNGAISDAFVSILNHDGSDLIYSTYLGGEFEDSGVDLAIGNEGLIYLTGYTNSIDFPVSGNAFSKYNHGQYDAFFSIIEPDRKKLPYSTYFGGIEDDKVNKMSLDKFGNATIFGWTQSSDLFITDSALDTTYSGWNEGFVTKFSGAEITKDTKGVYSGEIALKFVDDYGMKYIMIIDSLGGKRHLTGLQENVYCPVFSPDGKELLFTWKKSLKYIKDKNEEDFINKTQVYAVESIWLMDSANRDDRFEFVSSNNFTSNYNPRWFPEERKFLYISKPISPDSSSAIWIYDMNKGNSIKLDLELDIDNYELESADISPDGNYIVCVVSYFGNRFRDVYIKDLQKGDQVLFLEKKDDIEIVKWSPDGSRLLLKSGNENAYIISIDKRITKDLLSNIELKVSQSFLESYHLMDCDWSPEGNQIALSISYNGNNELWLTDNNLENPYNAFHLRENFVEELSWGGNQKIALNEKIIIPALERQRLINKTLFTMIGLLLVFGSLLLYKIVKKNKYDPVEDNEVREKEINNFRKELMLLLRDMVHSGMYSKIIDNLGFCIKNVYNGETTDKALMERLRSLANLYDEHITPIVKDIIILSEKSSISDLAYKKISNINIKIGSELRKILTKEEFNKKDSLYLIDIDHLIRSFETTIMLLMDELGLYFRTDVYECISEELSLFASKQGNNMNVAFDAEDLTYKNVLIDKFDLHFIIENLLSNAVEAVSGKVNPGIYIKAYSDIRKVYCEITDTGRGIPEDEWESLFIPTSKNNGNSTYGLPRSKYILHIFGGNLYIKESKIGEGTTIMLVLKVSEY